MAIPKMTIWQRQAYRLALMAHVMVHHTGPMVWWLGSAGMIITSHYGDPSAGLVTPMRVWCLATGPFGRVL